MKNLIELKDKRGKLKAEANELLSQDEVTEEQMTRAKAIVDVDIPNLDAQIELAKELEETRANLKAVMDEPEPRKVQEPHSRPQITDMVEGIERDPQRGTRHAGEFFRLVHRTQTEIATADEYLQLRAITGMGQAVAADGGILVPPAYAEAIWNGVNAAADSLLPRTDQYPVDGYESITFKANAETSRAAGSRYGGIRGYWFAEGDAITASYPKFRDLKLEPHEVGVLVYATDKLLRNAPALGRYLTNAAADELNFLIGDAIVNGTGAGQPKGLLNAGSKIEVAKETSQAADTILTANLCKMWARLHPRCRANAIWLYNVDCGPELDNLFTQVTNVAGSENVGGLNQMVYNQDKQTIKGAPLVPCEYCATVGDAGDLILTDLGYYATVVQSGGIDAAASIHVSFTSAQTCFRFKVAVDGDSWLGSAITPYKGSNTLSNIVTLAARA